jgi:hypothetical protein
MLHESRYLVTADLQTELPIFYTNMLDVLNFLTSTIPPL